jgi:hypothetical protein
MAHDCAGQKWLSGQCSALAHVRPARRAAGTSREANCNTSDGLAAGEIAADKDTPTWPLPQPKWPRTFCSDSLRAAAERLQQTNLIKTTGPNVP